MSQRSLFFSHLAQTSDAPLALEIESAEGIYLLDSKGNKYIDLISGISVSNVGHRHPAVIAAIEAQLKKHLHLMVYGEYIQSPQVRLAKLLADNLPASLSSVYFVNSGSEAVEGALKLAKRYTGRTEIISFKNAYHGSTQGALSVMGNEELKNPFRPLLPDVRFIAFNAEDDLEQISDKAACVIVEPVQGEAGVVVPGNNFLLKLRQKCDATGALLIFDEIQTGFGRTGNLFALETFKVIPDILLLAKGMGGGMPLGAFISSKEIMATLAHHPALGHITTFGGHPVCCAASEACLQTIIKEGLAQQVHEKGKLFLRLLKHPLIKEVRSKGLLIAVEFESEELNKKIIERCIASGVITDWFLFNAKSMRIAPPLTIAPEEIRRACEIILQAVEEAA